jgi:hypothetical protein
MWLDLRSPPTVDVRDGDALPESLTVGVALPVTLAVVDGVELETAVGDAVCVEDTDPLQLALGVTDGV